MTSSKRKVIITLGVIIVILLAGIVILLYNPRETPDSRQSSETIYDNISSGERGDLIIVESNLSSVEIIPQNGDRFTVTLDYSTGRLNAVADELIFELVQDELNMLIFSAVSLNSLIRIAENADQEQLSQFGFDNPRLKWIIHYENGTADTLIMGDNLPTGDGSYVKSLNGTEVYSIGQLQTSFLLKPLEEMYDISFLPIPPSTEENPTWMYISAVYLYRGEDDRITINRRTDAERSNMPPGSSVYFLTEPFQTDCSDYMIQTIFTEAVTHISPTSVVELKPADLSQYGLDNPYILTVGLPSQDNEDYSRTLYIGNHDTDSSGRYIMIEGHDAVLLDISGNYDFLGVDAFQLQAKLIWLHPIDTVSSVDFELDGINRALILIHNDILTGELDGVLLSSDNTRRLYTSALSILASGGTDAPIPDFPPVYTVTINFLEGGSETVELYMLDDSIFLIVHDGESTNSYITRISLYQNLLSKFEALDEGRDLGRS